MSSLDTEALLTECMGDNPAGESLEYDAAFQELERASIGKAGRYDPVSGQDVGGEEPEWPLVRRLATELFERTKDLRVAVILTTASLRLDGWPGLADGLGLISAMLERYWPTLYPNLDEAEGNDPIERLNALANLADAERFLPWVRGTEIVQARSVGSFSLRDLDLAQGRMSPREDESPPSLSVLSGAWLEGDDASNEERRAAVASAIEHIKNIRSIFQEQSGFAPDLDAIQKILVQVRDFYASVTPREQDASPSDVVEAEQTAGANLGVAVGTRAVGTVTSRTDAVRVLRQISEFIKQSEPSSPAPLFVDRAIRLLEMDFVDIVRELMPDARERVELISGVRFDEE